jgi:phage gpG-like protein
VITLRVSVNGNLREVETIAEHLSDLEVPLKAWNQYKRKQVQEIFDAGGPGWPQKKEGGSGDGARGSEASVRRRADDILRNKLRKELKRAQRRHASGRGDATKSAAAMARRYAVLKEFERIVSGGEVRLGSTGDAKLDKSVRGLRDRHARAAVKAAARPLGRIAQSIKSKVEKHAVEIKSTIPWAGAHNEGATVGHGAKLPERQFLDLTDADVDVLLILITMHVQGRR